MEISAKEAYNITKPIYDARRAKQMKSIFKQIRLCARKGELSYITEVIYPENEAELIKLGYTITHKFSMTHGRYAIIEWRNV